MGKDQLAANGLTLWQHHLHQGLPLLGTGQVSCYQWTKAVKSMWDLAEEVVVLYFHVGHDHVLHDVGEGYSEDGDVSCVDMC